MSVLAVVVLHAHLADCKKEVVFALEVQVQRPLAHPRALRHILEAGARESLFAEERRRRVEDLVRAILWAPLPALTALCMTGYLAAVTQSPITSFVIVMEMTNGTGFLIPMMAAALLASQISSAFTPALYDALARKSYPATSDSAP